MRTEMTHRERILAAVNHQPTDRVPMDYWGVPEITEKLMTYFGVKDMFGLSKSLDLDKIMGVSAPLLPGRANMWNLETKIILLPDGSGFYDEKEKFKYIALPCYNNRHIHRRRFYEENFLQYKPDDL